MREEGQTVRATDLPCVLYTDTDTEGCGRSVDGGVEVQHAGVAPSLRHKSAMIIYSRTKKMPHQAGGRADTGGGPRCRRSPLLSLSVCRLCCYPSCYSY